MQQGPEQRSDEERAASELPTLETFARRAIRIAEGIQRAETKQGDEFGLMAMVFLAKQTEHMKSLLRLSPHRDVGLVARAMVEGAGLLQWARNDPKARAQMWVAFAAVHDWRQMKLGQSWGKTFPAQDVADREAALGRYGGPFLTSKGKRRQREGRPPQPEDFKRDWHGMSPTEMLGEVQMPQAYLAAWGAWSQWQHWNSGLAAALTRFGDTVSLEPSSNTEAAIALMTGVDLLVLVARIVTDCLQLDAHRKDLGALLRDTDLWLKGRQGGSPI